MLSHPLKVVAKWQPASQEETLRRVVLPSHLQKPCSISVAETTTKRANRMLERPPDFLEHFLEHPRSEIFPVHNLKDDFHPEVGEKVPDKD